MTDKGTTDAQKKTSVKTGDPADDPRARMTRGAHVQLAIVLIFIIGGFVLSQTIGGETEPLSETRETRPMMVDVVEVPAVTRPILFEKTGTTEIETVIDIVPQVSGRVVFTDPVFRDGGVFDEGQVLFTIEQDNYTNRVAIARAEVEQAQTRLALEEAESEAARKEWRALYPKQFIPPLVARQPQMEQAQADLKAAEARLEEAALDLRRTEYSLPYAGRIIETGIDVGQYVQAGQAYGRLYPRGALQVRIPVEDRLLPYLDREESEVTIETDYGGERLALTGRIARFGGQLDERTRFVDVIAVPTGPRWDELLPNVFASVILKGRETEDLWFIPNAAMQGRDSVWIVGADGRLRQYEPDIITVNADVTVARGTGEDVRLVRGLLKGARDGMPVEIRNGAGNKATAPTDTPLIDPQTNAAQNAAGDGS